MEGRGNSMFQKGISPNFVRSYHSSGFFFLNSNFFFFLVFERDGDQDIPSYGLFHHFFHMFHMEQHKRRLSILDRWRSRREWLWLLRGRHDWKGKYCGHWTRPRQSWGRFRPETVLARWSVSNKCMGSGSVRKWHRSWVPRLSRDSAVC